MVSHSRNGCIAMFSHLRQLELFAPSGGEVLSIGAQKSSQAAIRTRRVTAAIAKLGRVSR